MQRTAILAIGSFIFWSACSSEAPPERDDEKCEAGRSLSCACTNGMQGAQRCRDDGTLGDCVCAEGVGGSNADSGGSTSSGGAGLGGSKPTGGAPTNGGSATGGSVTGGSGGTSGAGTGGMIATGGISGTTGTGGAGGDPDNWVDVSVTYDGSITRTLSHIYSLTPSYSAMTGEGKIIYQVEDGYSQVTVDVRPASSGGGYEVLLMVSDANMSLPARIRGGYYETAATRPFTYVPLESSCVTFTELELEFGGVMAGTIDCMLLGGNDTTPVPATATGSFRGVLPQ